MRDLFERIARLSQDHQVFIDVSGLILAVIIVHACYLVFVIPSAETIMTIANAANEVPPRVLSIIIKDGEQEICLILTLWCLWLWVFRYRFFQDESFLLKTDFLQLKSLTQFSETTLNSMQDRVQNLRRRIPGSNLLGGIETAIDELKTHSNFKDATTAAHTHCDLHLEVLESKLNITKYILWAIPSVGFLGTVRGIGQALARADEAVAGDISGVASSLGVAFNSTFVALFLSLLLMFVSYILQGREERLVAGFKGFVSVDLIPRLRSLKQLDDQTSSSLASTSEQT